MRLLIAGGGTGGHLFPGVAIAEELRARDPTPRSSSSAPQRGIEARVLPELGWDLELIEVSGPQDRRRARRAQRAVPAAARAVAGAPRDRSGSGPTP